MMLFSLPLFFLLVHCSTASVVSVNATQNQYIENGQPGNLTCKADSVEINICEWYVNATQLLCKSGEQNCGNKKVFLENGTCHLEFNETRAADSGEYRCWMTHASQGSNSEGEGNAL